MKKIKFASILSIIVISAAAVCFFYKPVYYRLYFGNRITGDIQVSVNNKPKLLNSDDIYQIYFCDDSKIKFKNSGDMANVSIKGGSYGNYTFGVDIPDINKTIEITAMQFNWWNVTEFDLDISVDTDQNSILYTYSYTNIAEDGSIQYENGSKRSSADDDLKIYIGG